MSSEASRITVRSYFETGEKPQEYTVVPGDALFAPIKDDLGSWSILSDTTESGKRVVTVAHSANWKLKIAPGWESIEKAHIIVSQLIAEYLDIPEHCKPFVTNGKNLGWHFKNYGYQSALSFLTSYCSSTVVCDTNNAKYLSKPREKDDVYHNMHSRAMMRRAVKGCSNVLFIGPGQLEKPVIEELLRQGVKVTIADKSQYPLYQGAGGLFPDDFRMKRVALDLSGRDEQVQELSQGFIERMENYVRAKEEVLLIRDLLEGRAALQKAREMGDRTCDAFIRHVNGLKKSLSLEVLEAMRTRIGTVDAVVCSLVHSQIDAGLTLHLLHPWECLRGGTGVDHYATVRPVAEGFTSILATEQHALIQGWLSDGARVYVSDTTERHNCPKSEHFKIEMAQLLMEKLRKSCQIEEEGFWTKPIGKFEVDDYFDVEALILAPPKSASSSKENKTTTSASTNQAAT